MNEATLKVVTYELADLYEKKIAKVLSTSVQYDVYAKLIADLYTEGARDMAVIAEHRANETDRKAIKNVYRQYCLNYQKVMMKHQAA